MLKKVLVANRGEIALRVIRTCRSLGVQTVAIYSPWDRDELYVRCSDEAYPLEGEEGHYLDMEQILRIGLSSGCDGLHPGYGFLAENAEFARLVEDSPLTWIGPSSRCIAWMGDKVAARAAMKAAGVPVIPGTEEAVSPARLEEAAGEVGFPLMLKAQGGGGGKGMRIVHSLEELSNAFERARSEAKAAFGSESIYFERYIPFARHVEVQIFGDGEGNCVSIGERDCSLQRRHQKMIEEAPCSFISESTRERLHRAAQQAGASIGYRGAGTVEFLVDREERFYFLEMNTRLQVEHPVTELVYGLDLVELQLRVASGDLALPCDLSPRGHAIEVRILAEDPYENFMPSVGRITALELPGGPGIRLDSSLYLGQEITPYYDSLLAKLIAYGRDRRQAQQRAVGALEEFHIQGVMTNISYARQVLEDPAFLRDEYHTRSLEEELAPRYSLSDLDRAAAVAAFVAYLQDDPKARIASSEGGKNPWKLSGRIFSMRRGWI